MQERITATFPGTPPLFPTRDPQTLFYYNCNDVRESYGSSGRKQQQQLPFIQTRRRERSGYVTARHTKRMSLRLLCFLLLSVAMASIMRVSGGGPPHGFRGCTVREFTFMAQKPGCKGVRVTTGACWGRCLTWERPTLEPPFVQRHHSVCTYGPVRHVSVRLPGCPAGVTPLYHYPVALQCHCSLCSTQDTECETF